MKRPTINSNYTKEDLKEYALYRKNEEMKSAKAILSSDLEDYKEHEEYREPLAVSKSTLVIIELSWGGDADGYKLTYRRNKLESGVYYWADWGVYEEVALSDEELEQIAQIYLSE